MGLGSPAALARLDTGAAGSSNSSSSNSSSSSSAQRTVDAVSLINLCNAFRTPLDNRVLQADNSDLAAPISRLLNLMLHLTPQQLCAGTSQTLSNCSNFVRTLFEMGLHAQPDMNQALVDNPAFDAWVRARTPSRRWGRPEELVGAAVFLASAASDYVNGQIIYVDGGMLAVL